MYFAAAQVYEAVFEPQFFRRRVFGEDGHGHLFGFAQYVETFGDQFYFAGRQFWVDVFVGAVGYDAVERYYRFLCEVRDGFLERAVGIYDDLREAVVVSQVNKQYSAVVAAVVDPAADSYELADVFFPKFAACMRAVLM